MMAPTTRKAMWVMYDMTVNRLPRREAFKRLRELGIARREAAELIHFYEREG
jgi:hypothetical protein